MLSDGSRAKGRAIVFSAPSGAGKTTLIHRAMEELEDLQFSISATTRPQRKGEEDGVDYDFITHEEFEAGLEAGDFIEHENVHGQLYGTRYKRVQPLLDSGIDVVFDLDVLGALRLKEFFPDSFLLYIDVLSTDVLRQRLLARGREDEAEIERRLERYVLERSKAEQFDRIIVNDDLDRATREVVDAINEFRSSRK